MNRPHRPNHPSSSRGSRAGRPGVVLVLALAACGGGDPGAAADPNLITVVRRTLPITIKENAELQALRETVVRSQVEGQATIIYLIEEGRIVEKDELLVRLDASDLEDKRANQRISVSKADAARTQAHKSLEILEKELTTRRNTAASNLTIAEMELEKFMGRRQPAGVERQGKNASMVKKLRELVEEPMPIGNAAPATGPVAALAPGETPAPEAQGEAPAPAAPAAMVSQIDPRRYRRLVDKVVELLQDEGSDESGLDRDMGDMANKILNQVDQIKLAMADLKYQEAWFGHSRRLADKQFITENELEKDKIEFERRLSRVGLAWNDLDLLINYELFKNKIKLLQDVANARLELERVDASNDAERLRASTDLDSKVAEYTLAKERLDNLDRQITNAEIRAPTPGLVIYARLERDRRSSESIREGISVRERQDLIILPDTTRMQAIVKVQEAVVAQVRTGQLAHITVEAYPDRVFTGRVTRVAQQADSSSGWMTSDRKVYTTVVVLDGDNDDGELRSRMAAAVTILVDELKDVMAVPLQAVRRDRSVNYVWKATPQGPQATVVEVGRNNSEHVVVTAGIREGDRIYLAPPPGVQPPELPQPEVPMPEVKVPTAPGAAAPGAAAPAGAQAPDQLPGGAPAAMMGDRPARPGGGPGNGPGPGPGGRGQMKKLTEMTAEELDEFKATGLSRYPRMIDMLHQSGQAELAGQIEARLPEIEQALTAGNLEQAQALLDSLRAMSRSAMGARGRRPGDGGGEGGERQGRGN